MKIRSFTISLIFSIVLSTNLPSCGALPISPTSTPLATQTATLVIPSQTAIATSTEIPTETSTPTAELVSETQLVTIDLTDGTKWEMPAFTNSQEALQFIADRADWYDGDKFEVWAEKIGPILQPELSRIISIKDIDINIENSGILPPNATERRGHFFYVAIGEIKTGGLVLFYISESKVYALFLDKPDFQDTRNSLAHEIIKEIEIIIPQN